MSLTHNQIEGVPLGQYPWVSYLCKGMYNSRPPQPRYTNIWDVDMMIRQIIALGENSNLSFKQLSHKLAILMALVGANRVSELCALDLHFCQYHLNGFHFELPSLGKERTVGAPQKQVTLRVFSHQTTGCALWNV